MDCPICNGDGYVVEETGDGESGPQIDASLCDECVWGQTLIVREAFKDLFDKRGVAVPAEEDIPQLVEYLMNTWEMPSQPDPQEWQSRREMWTQVVTATVAYLRSSVGRAESAYRNWKKLQKVADEAHSYFQGQATMLSPDESLDLARACERNIPTFA